MLWCALQSTPAASAPTLAPHRVLWLFAESRNQPELVEQRKRLEAAPLELAERDVRIEEVIGPHEARQRWRAPDRGFLLVLVGKDGTAKMRRSQPVALAEILSLIDGMPMRKAEMEQRRQRP